MITELEYLAAKKIVSEYEGKAFDSSEIKRIEFVKKVYFISGYTDKMMNEFIEYWCEKSVNGKKMRFEMEKVFDVSKRLARWKNNNFNGQTSKKPAGYSVATVSDLLADFSKPLTTDGNKLLPDAVRGDTTPSGTVTVDPARGSGSGDAGDEQPAKVA